MHQAQVLPNLAVLDQGGTAGPGVSGGLWPWKAHPPHAEPFTPTHASIKAAHSEFSSKVRRIITFLACERPAHCQAHCRRVVSIHGGLGDTPMRVCG